MLEDALACQGSTCARVQLDSSLDLLLVLLLLLHKVGCPCRRTPWLARDPGGLLLLKEILVLALGPVVLVIVLPVRIHLFVPVGNTSARSWIPGVLLDGAVLLDRAALDGSGLVHGLHGLQRRLDVSLAGMEALLDGPCGTDPEKWFCTPSCKAIYHWRLLYAHAFTIGTHHAVS